MRLARLQSELGAVFCALWTAHTRRVWLHGSREHKSDPRLRTEATISFSMTGRAAITTPT
eukprot:1781920-Pyramimonas_sp.AAC.1